MKITLLQPPSPLLLEDRIMIPIGLVTLGALLEEKGHEVNIIDLAGVKDWKSAIQKESHKLDDCEWYGTTSTTPQYSPSMKITNFIKHELGYKMPSVIGGMHTTSECYSNNLDFLNKDPFDSYVNGEGYNAVLKICDDIENKNLKKLYTEPIWKDVNTLPYADRDLLDIKNYNYKLGGNPATTIYLQYGCYYECSYCESKMAGSFTVRAMTPKRAIDEIKYIREKWGYNYFMDFSDEMNLNRDRYMGLCDEYRKAEIGWRGFLVTAKWDDEMAKAAKSSGCFQIASGIESFSDQILRTISKPSTAAINKRFIRICKKNGLNTKAFMIVGLPTESWKTIKETYLALKELKDEGLAPDDIDVSVLQVYHGSNIFRDRAKLDIQFEDYLENTENMYYKSMPGSYESLIQVQTKSMSKWDLVSARNFLEYVFKKKGWIKEYSDRKDLDAVYQKDNVFESIKYAAKKLDIPVNSIL